MPLAHAVGQQHAVQGHQGAHRDINAAGEHNACHAAGHADQARVADEDVEKGLKIGEALASVHDAASRIEDDKQYDGDDQQQGVAVHLFAAFYGVCRFHAWAASFPAAGRAAVCLRTQFFTGGAWMTTMTITTTALNTGATALDTPRLYMVVVMAWMV